MSNHISDDLPRLLTGDASREITMAAAEHLRACPDCQQELVSAVVAHASLTSAHRFAPEVVNPAADDHREAPSISPLPDLAPMFAQVRVEAATETARPGRRRTALLAVAAAAVVAAGVVTLVEVNGSGSAPSTRSVALTTQFGSPTKSSAVLVGDNRIKLDAASLPTLHSGQAYEVWLTDTDTGHGDLPQSVGFIDNSTHKADLSVQSWLLSQYDSIAVSVQKSHETAYSGTTVLQGAYRA